MRRSGPGPVPVIEKDVPAVAMALPIPVATQPPSLPGSGPGPGPGPAAKWLSQVIFKRNPYFPQMGDDLVYLRQAHELYAKAWSSIKLTQKKNSKDPWDLEGLTPKLQNPIDLPYVTIPTLRAAEAVTVIGVEFKISSSYKKKRFAKLQLELTDWNTGLRTGQVFTVKYKDIDGVSDFLVLRQIYDQSLNRHRRWNASDKFRFMDPSRNLWVVGTVLKKQVLQAKFPGSHFQSYRVQWDGTKFRRALSPWDMEPIPTDFEVLIPPNPYRGVPATEIDVNLSKAENGAYEIQQEDWLPSQGQEIECARISRVISQVISLPLGTSFQDRYEKYERKVAYPVDLHVIRERLDQLFYRRPAAILTDVENIYLSAAKIFDPDAAPLGNAQLVCELLKEVVATPEIVDISDCASPLTPIYAATDSSTEEDEDASESEAEATYRSSVSVLANVRRYHPNPNPRTVKVPKKKAQKRSIEQMGVGVGGGVPPATGSVKKPHRFRPGLGFLLGYPDKDLDVDDDSDDLDYIP